MSGKEMREAEIQRIEREVGLRGMSGYDDEGIVPIPTSTLLGGLPWWWPIATFIIGWFGGFFVAMAVWG